MQAGVGLLVTDVMPIYIIIGRYSHNYAQFYQLLDSNSFTHCNTYALERSHSSENYGPRVYLPSYYFHISLLFLLPLVLQSLFSNLYHKNTKKIILLSLSDLTFAGDREGINNPFIALVARFLFVCAGTRDLRIISY